MISGSAQQPPPPPQPIPPPHSRQESFCLGRISYWSCRHFFWGGVRGLLKLRILLCTLNARFVQTSLALRYLEAIGRATPQVVARAEFTTNDPLGLVEAEIHRAAPDLLAFSCYLWNIEPQLELCDSLKKVRPELLTLLGGPEVSFDAPAILAANPAVDFIIAGEGERAWAAFLRALPAGEYPSVPGLCWRDKGEIRANAPPPPLPLAELPSAYEDELPDLHDRLAYYESSRGCPFACAFCLSGQAEGVRFADPERVLAEVARLAGSGAVAVKFVDRTFNCQPGHAMAVWRGLLRHQGRMRFHFEIVAELLTGEEISFLETVPPGLFQFEIGIQSTNPETLAAVGRRMDLDRLAANVRALKAPGNIHLHLDLIAGLPYEDFDRFLESLDFGLALAPDAIQLGFLKMLRGSRLRAEAAALGYTYRRRPPYEILGDPWLSFAELCRLKIAADLLDAFYNEGRFAASLPRLFARAASPARFFADLAAYSEETGWHRRAHQARDLPEHLLAYAERRGLADPVLRDCLRLDLHCLGRHDAEPPWADVPAAPDLQNRWRAWLQSPEHRALLGPEFAESGVREALRRTRPLVFRHDPTAPPGAGEPGPAAVAVVYPEQKVGRIARAVRIEGLEG